MCDDYTEFRMVFPSKTNLDLVDGGTGGKRDLSTDFCRLDIFSFKTITFMCSSQFSKVIYIYAKVCIFVLL